MGSLILRNEVPSFGQLIGLGSPSIFEENISTTGRDLKVFDVKTFVDLYINPIVLFYHK